MPVVCILIPCQFGRINCSTPTAPNVHLDTLTRVQTIPPSWPGSAFVAHWGRPEPWRSLTLRQRERLLCLAASSGHAPSLDAALAHCGCVLKPEVLTAAAAADNLATCERLLHGEGCSFHENALTAAAQDGHLQVLQLLLRAVGRRLYADLAADAAEAATYRRCSCCCSLLWVRYTPDTTLSHTPPCLGVRWDSVKARALRALRALRAPAPAASPTS